MCKPLYKTKPQLAIEIIKELRKWNFNIKLILADSLYGESGDVITTFSESNLEYIVAIGSNHKVWMLGKEKKDIIDGNLINRNYLERRAKLDIFEKLFLVKENTFASTK